MVANGREWKTWAIARRPSTRSASEKRKNEEDRGSGQPKSAGRKAIFAVEALN
jgi:hypothetical protein